MGAVKHFMVAIPNNDGGITMYPMKKWLRAHPDQNSTSLDPGAYTSHQLRDALRNHGWSVRETPSEVILLKPGDSAGEATIEEVMGAEANTDESYQTETEAAELVFTLESQLRDFISQNLGKMTVGQRRLRLFHDPASGRNGIEFATGVGFIDILAVDEAGDFFVLELKRASSPDHAIGQLARYMGWVKKIMYRADEGGLWSYRCKRDYQ